MKGSTLYLRWVKGKALGVKIGGGELEVIAANTKIALHPRDIVVEGKVKGYEDIVAGKRKYVYVYFNEPLIGLTPPRIDLGNVEVIGGFEIRVTRINSTGYLTIITPGAYLYNYVIISLEALSAEVNTRREVYYEDTGTGVAVYIL